jgi:hypothetical protein
MTDIKKLIASSNDLLSEIKGSKSHNSSSEDDDFYYTTSGKAIAKSHQVFKSVSVLAPEGYIWEDIWLHLYNPSEIPETPPVGTTVIVHGHEKTTVCLTPYFCHILGYKPKDGGSKFWKMKWGTKLSVTFVSNPFGTNRQVE